MKFLREDNQVTYCGEDPIDRNDPEGAKDAVEMTLPTGFPKKPGPAGIISKAPHSCTNTRIAWW